MNQRLKPLLAFLITILSCASSIGFALTLYRLMRLYSVADAEALGIALLIGTINAIALSYIIPAMTEKL